MDNIKQQIRNVLATVLNVDIAEISDDCSYGSTEHWDSLGHMKIVVAIEEEFGIRFDDDEVSDMLNFLLIYNFVSIKLRENRLDSSDTSILL